MNYIVTCILSITSILVPELDLSYSTSLSYCSVSSFIQLYMHRLLAVTLSLKEASNYVDYTRTCSPISKTNSHIHVQYMEKISRATKVGPLNGSRVVNKSYLNRFDGAEFSINYIRKKKENPAQSSLPCMIKFR